MIKIVRNELSFIHRVVAVDLINQREATIGHIEQIGDKFYPQTGRGFQFGVTGYRDVQTAIKTVVRAACEKGGIAPW